AEADEADETLAGSFASPDEVQGQGTASEVARELDDQPETAAAAVTVTATATPSDSPEPGVDAWSRVERIARHTCALINMPLNRLSDETRNTIGYAGVLTTLTAIGLILA